MADFRAFLAPVVPVVLPYFGGTRVDAKDRRYQLATDEVAVGWWRFRIAGRRATPVDAAAPEAGALASLPTIRGHWVDGWIAVDGRALARVALPPDDEPALLSRVTARRWYSGDLVLETVDFEDDAEVAARAALDERRALGDVRGATPSLRVAFALAIGGAVARETGAEASPRELVARAAAIADGGPEVVRAYLAELIAERERAREEARRLAETIRLESVAGTARSLTRRGDPVQRADDALDRARARMIRCQRLERGARLDVTYEVDGTRIISMVDAETLQVLDPGLCLSGQHRVLTLDAMPSVVREAIEEHHLNITRRP